MSNSETSSDLEIKISGERSDVKKSSDTDMYFNMIANISKTVPDKQEVESTSELESSESNKSTSSIRRDSSSESSSKSKSSSKSRDKYTSFNMSPKAPSNPSFTPPKVNHSVTVEMSPHEIRMRKIELLRRLAEIKQKGYSLSKDYDFNSSIADMEYEYELLKSFADKRNGVKMYKNILLNGVSLIEWLNDKYDPFDFHLQGWGEHMSVEVDSYDDVLEELYEKYKGTGKKMPPEVKLLLLLAASGAAFHFSKSQSSVPGLDQVLSKNPELVSKLLNPQKAQSQFQTQQEINIQKQRELIQQREKELKQQMKQNTRPMMSEPAPANQSGNKISQQGAPEIRAPGDVQEILGRLKRAQANVQFSEMTEDSNNDRLVSEGTVSESRKRKQISKPAISINTG
jgi:hypothetical protein